MSDVSAETPVPKVKRAPRQDYGFKPNAIITLTGKETKYRGARKEWFDTVVKYQGQTVKAWDESHLNPKDSPRGWLRFFVQDGAVSLVSAQ